MNWYLYIVKCKDDSLYTGISPNVEARVVKHNFGIGAKSLKGKLPVQLVFSEKYRTHPEAAKREREIKSWNRKKKLQLIKGSSWR